MKPSFLLVLLISTSFVQAQEVEKPDSALDEIDQELEQAAEQQGDVEWEGEEEEVGAETKQEQPTAPPVQKPSSGDSDSGSVSATAEQNDPGLQSSGSYKVYIGAAKPIFSDLDRYEEFYGETGVMPVFGVDYFFFDWFASMGIGLRLGYYKDTGKAANVSGDDVTKDPEAPVEMTLVPTQTVVTLRVSPFRAKWITLGAWGGAEAMYFQEVRLDPEEDGVSSSSSDSSSDERPFINTGWKYAVTTGGSVSFLLNALEERPVKSMNTMGLGYVYLTPFFEVVTPLAKKNASFARTVLGLAFSFETI